MNGITIAGDTEFAIVQCIEHGLTLRGIDAGPPRLPLRPLDKDEKRELGEVIRTMNATIAAIGKDAENERVAEPRGLRLHRLHA